MKTRMRQPRRAATVLLACALAACAVPGGASAATVGFFEQRASQEAVLSEMVIHPAAIEASGTTVIAYQGRGFDPYVVSYTAATGAWRGPYRAGTNPLRLDAHGAPALFRDALGRMHVLYGSHSRPMLHAVAGGPASLSVWSPRAAVDPIATYPQPLEMGGGKVLLYYRGASSHWYERSASGACDTFGAARAVLAAEATTWWYADFRDTPDGGVDAAFVAVDVPEYYRWEFARHHVYFMHRAPDGSWSALDGTPLAMPLTRAEADAHCRILDSGTRWTNELSSLRDAAGRPCVLVLVGGVSGAGAFSWRFLRYDGSAWRSSEITVTDHFYDAGTVRFTSDGTLEAFLVYGESDAEGSVASDERGRGGTIGRWTSADGGATWALADANVSPAEPGSLFSDPVLVLGGTPQARLVFTDWNNDESDFERRMFLWSESGLVQRELPLTITRVAGADRVGTAIAASRRSFPEGSRQVVIAGAASFSDALAGGPLAHALHGPLLLTARGGLSPGVLEEVRRLGPTRVVLLGGTAALAPAVESSLRAAGFPVKRIGGPTRYDTAAAVAREMRDPTRAEQWVVVASGRDWPDAASAVPIAANLGCPILLTEPGVLPTQTVQVLAEWGTSRTLVPGGPDVVGEAVLARLPGAERVGGDDRYETSALLARWGIEHVLLPNRIVVASGAAFPDVLSGGPMAARSRAPMLLTRRDALPAPAAGYVAGIGASLVEAMLLGQEDVVGARVASEVASLAP